MNSRSVSKPAVFQPVDIGPSVRQATTRTVRFDLPSEPATSPGTSSTDLPQVVSSTPYLSQPASGGADEVRPPVPPVPPVASASSAFRQTSTPSSSAFQKPPPSQAKDRSPPKAVEQQSLESPMASSQTPAKSGVASSSPSAAVKALPAKSPHMEGSDAQSATRTLAPPLANLSSQAIPIPTRHESVVQTTPLQSMQITKVNDAPPPRRPDDLRAVLPERSLKQVSLEVNVGPQQQIRADAPASWMSSAPDHLRSNLPQPLPELQPSSKGGGIKTISDFAYPLFHTLPSLCRRHLLKAASTQTMFVRQRKTHNRSYPITMELSIILLPRCIQRTIHMLPLHKRN